MFWPHFGQQLFGIVQLLKLGMSSVLQERQQLLNTYITPILPPPHHLREAITLTDSLFIGLLHSGYLPSNSVSPTLISVKIIFSETPPYFLDLGAPTLGADAVHRQWRDPLADLVPLL